MKFLAPVLSLAWMGLLALAGTAHAGTAPWCKAKVSVGEYDLKDLSSDEPRRVLVMLAKTACSADPPVEQQRAKIDASRDAWGKKFGLRDADWADVLAMDANPSYMFKANYQAKTLNELGPIDQYGAIAEGFINKDARKLSDPFYMADAFDANLSQTGRLAVVDYCLKDDTTGDDGAFSRWAVCQDDFDKFDPEKVYDEVRADTARAGELRMVLRLLAHDMPARIAKLNDKKAALFKKDPEYKRAYDIVAAARADWAKGAGAKKDLLSLVQAMESATFFHSRSQFDGCQAKTTPALAAAISTIPAKAFATAHDQRDDPFKGFAYKAAPVIANTPVAYLAAIAFALCQPTSGTGLYTASVVNSVPGTRGPRTTALGALMGTQWKFDDTNKKGLDYPKVDARPTAGTDEKTQSAGGVVKSTKHAKGQRGDMKDKDITAVVLEKTLIQQEDCVKEHRGNHIARIDSTNHVEYESICDKTAMVTHDHTWTNLTVNSDHAKWLKPGVVFSANYGMEGGDVLAVWPSKSATVPTMVLGGAVK